MTERRPDPREPVMLKVEYPDADGLIHDYAENISHGGTFVLTERALEVGANVHLVLSFPGLLKALHLDGIVKWQRRDPPEERGVGVEWITPDESARLGGVVERIAQRDPELVARNLRVLLVEDNPHVATLIRDGLVGVGRREMRGKVTFSFTTVNNGRDALDMLGNEKYDLLIIDIYLPVLDGVHVIREVRARAELAGLPIIAVSAGGGSAGDDAIAAGADHFLEKPMRLVDIMATLKQIRGVL